MRMLENYMLYDTKHNTHHIIGCTGFNMWPLILVQLLLDIISTYLNDGGIQAAGFDVGKRL